MPHNVDKVNFQFWSVQKIFQLLWRIDFFVHVLFTSMLLNLKIFDADPALSAVDL